MATVFTIKLTHITTGVEKVIPITQRDFMNFVTCREREYLQVELLKEKEDRKSVVQGKSVDLGGRRIIKKKKRKKGVPQNK